jgi:tRNA threonylcarbamoyladenosine biosynthesis protein TsaE
MQGTDLNPIMKTFECKNPQQTENAGIHIAEMLGLSACVYLSGEMGAGKTTLCQAIIRASGYQGVVTSPTYNLIHEYQFENGTVYHLDLYRIEDSSELEYLAIADLLHDKSLLLIEWPCHGKGYLPAATHCISLALDDQKPNQHRIITFSENK